MAEVDAVGDALVLCVFLGDSQGVLADIGGDEGGGGVGLEQLLGQGDDDGARACADVSDAWRGEAGGSAVVLEDVLDEGFSGGPGDEDGGADLEHHGEERGFADEVIDRLVFHGAFDELAEGGTLEVAGRSVGVHVELEAGLIKDVGQKHLGTDAGRVDAFVFEGLGGPLDEALGCPGLVGHGWILRGRRRGVRRALGVRCRLA